MSTVNHPLFGNPHRDREARFIKGLQTACPKHPGQSKLIKEILALELLPLSPTLIDSSAWDNHMAMRMIIQASGMSMKNRRHTDVGSQISRIEAKVFQGTGSTIEQDVVNSGLVTPSERTKFVDTLFNFKLNFADFYYPIDSGIA